MAQDLLRVPHRGLSAALLGTLLASGCTTEGLPLPLPDFGGGDGEVLHAVDLALPANPCGEGWKFWTAVGPPGKEFPLGGDGAAEHDAHVTRDGSGAIVLGSSGGLSEVQGSYQYSMEHLCNGPCTLRRL